MTHIRLIIALASLAAWAYVPGCGTLHAESAERIATRYEYARVLMGTRCRIVVESPSEPVAAEACAAAFARIAELDLALSDWNPNSEASRLMRLPAGAWHEVSPDLAAALARSVLVHAASSGAFDPTVAPATKLWRETRRSGELPDETKRLDAVARIGLDQITLEGSRVRFDRDGLGLDFGGIGKGMACDEAGAVLRARGIDAFLIDFGGDLLAGDAPTGEAGWRVSVRDGVAVERSLTLARGAVATSGELEQFVEIDGVRYSHIVDPKTALGLKSRVAATVRADHAWLADALASAACVGSDAVLDDLRLAFPGAAIFVSRAGDADSTASR